MNINAMGSMQQMQTQSRVHQGEGSGKGKGSENGMKDIMQNLSSQDKAILQEQLSSLSSEEKSSIKEQLKAVDNTNLNSTEYLQLLLDAIGNSTNDSSSTEAFTPIYA